MAARFWVGGTGTWDASDTTHWASSSNGAGGQSVPGSSDDVTFDGSSGGGTVTVNAVHSILSMTWGAFTGTIDFATNNNNITIGSVNGSGSGTRTLNMGSGTWTITATTGTVWSTSTNTNLTLNAGTSKVLFAATPTGVRTMSGGISPAYNEIEINNTSETGAIPFVIGSVTATTLTLTAVRWVQIQSGTTSTITNLTYTGTSVAPVMLSTSSLATGVGTISTGGTCTAEWASIWGITKTGAGSFTASNSTDHGNNTSVTITPPSVGGVVARVIGG